MREKVFLCIKIVHHILVTIKSNTCLAVIGFKPQN